MELCGMVSKPYRETELTLKNILSKHDTLDGNRLSREGFLSYYRDVAATDPRQVSQRAVFKNEKSTTREEHHLGHVLVRVCRLLRTPKEIENESGQACKTDGRHVCY